MTLTELIASVNQKLKSDPKFTTAIITTELNNAQIQVAVETGCLDDSKDINVTASTAEYDYPTVAPIPLYLKGLLFYNGGVWEKLKYIPFNKYLEMDSNITGTPEGYYDRPGKKKFGIYPASSIAVTSGLRLYMVDQPTTLVASTYETPDLPVFTHMALVFYACWMLMSGDGQDTQAAMFKGFYDQQIYTIKKKLSPQVARYIYEDESEE